MKTCRDCWTAEPEPATRECVECEQRKCEHLFDGCEVCIDCARWAALAETSRRIDYVEGYDE